LAVRGELGHGGRTLCAPTVGGDALVSDKNRSNHIGLSGFIFGHNNQTGFFEKACNISRFIATDRFIYMNFAPKHIKN